MDPRACLPEGLTCGPAGKRFAAPALHPSRDEESGAGAYETGANSQTGESQSVSHQDLARPR